MRRNGGTAAKLRIAIGYLLEQGFLNDPSTRTGAQSRLAEHFGVSRQRVAQLVAEEKAKRV